jgi:hypothetical protein
MSVDAIVEVERCEPRTMKSDLQLEENPLVACSCGRKVNADMMRAYGDGYSCDACHETMFRNGDLSREDFARSHGASDAVIAKASLQDAARVAIEEELSANVAI